MGAWLSQNAKAIGAVCAVVTALVAVAALVGVKLQIDASDRLQRDQAARDIYRGFLALSIQHPQVQAFDYCAAAQVNRLAYESYVEYLLYTAEQVIDADGAWHGPIHEHLTPHRMYLCSRGDWSGYTPAVERLIGKAQVSLCEGSPACG